MYRIDTFIPEADLYPKRAACQHGAVQPRPLRVHDAPDPAGHAAPLLAPRLGPGGPLQALII